MDACENVYHVCDGSSSGLLVMGDCRSSRIGAVGRREFPRVRRSMLFLVKIVEEVYKVWEKVISDRQGLYSIDKPDSSPLAPTEKQEVKHKSSTINPHGIFFRVIDPRRSSRHVSPSRL